MNPNKSKIVSALYPELAPQIKQQETNDLLKILIENSNKKVNLDGIEMIKGEKGDDGYTPIKGIDYTDGYTPIKNVDYFDGIDGYTPVPGVDFEVPDENKIYNRLLKKIPDAIPGKDGIDGKDGSPDTAEQIVEKINTLESVIDPKTIIGYETSDDVIRKIKENKLDMRDIKGMPLNMNDMRWHGSGIPSLTAGAGIVITDASDGGKIVAATGGSGYTILTTTGTIDDSNLDFPFDSLPTELVINAGSYIQTGGSTTWTWNAGTLTATLSTPVGTGGSIYGRS